MLFPVFHLTGLGLETLGQVPRWHRWGGTNVGFEPASVPVKAARGACVMLTQAEEPEWLPLQGVPVASCPVGGRAGVCSWVAQPAPAPPQSNWAVSRARV